MDNLTLLLDNLIFFFLYILFLIIHTLYNYTYPFDYPYQIMDNNVPENFFGNRWISKLFILIRCLLIRCLLIRCILIRCILIRCMFTGSSVFPIYSTFWTFLENTFLLLVNQTRPGWSHHFSRVSNSLLRTFLEIAFLLKLYRKTGLLLRFWLRQGKEKGLVARILTKARKGLSIQNATK